MEKVDEVTGLVKLAFQWGKADNKEIKTIYRTAGSNESYEKIEENKGNRGLSNGWDRDGLLFYIRKGLINNVTYM